MRIGQPVGILWHLQRAKEIPTLFPTKCRDSAIFSRDHSNPDILPDTLQEVQQSQKSIDLMRDCGFYLDKVSIIAEKTLFQAPSFLTIIHH